MLIAGNWKMFKGPGETRAFGLALRDVDLPANVDVVVCPPYVSLGAAAEVLAGTEIGVFAQNCHWESEGAFTGEVSAAMLRELGVYGTIVGHSERRQFFGDTDETVGRRCAAALEAGLHVIACVGETESEREAGETEAVLRRQVGALEADDNLVIAYEPVWAIGTGKTATPEIARQAHETIKSILDRPCSLRRLGEGGERGRASRAPCGRRRARRRRIPRRRFVRGDMPGSGAPLVALVILDGWGCAPPGPGNAVDLAATPVFDELWASHPAHDARRVRRGRRPPARADGKQRGGAPDDRGGPAPLPGPDARQPRRSRTGASSRTPSSSTRSRAAGACTCSGSSRTAACTRTSTT